MNFLFFLLNFEVIMSEKLNLIILNIKYSKKKINEYFWNRR